MSASISRWHTVCREALTWRQLDGEVAVYNAQSGSTHLLEPLAGDVLRTLVEEGSGMTVPDLISRLRGNVAADDFSDWFAAIENVLSEFERLGLAEQIKP